MISTTSGVPQPARASPRGSAAVAMAALFPRPRQVRCWHPVSGVVIARYFHVI